MRRYGFFVLVLCLLPAMRPLSAAILNVPADVPTIQGAMDAAVNGDTVLVAPGTYFENLNYRGKHIVVASHYLQDGDPATIAATIIDGSQPVHADTGSVVLLISGENSTAVLEGFTIQGGTGTPLRDQANGQMYVEGGGIMTENSSPVIRHNIVRNNSAIRMPSGITSAGGGGIRIGFGAPLVEGNVFMNNQGRYGGGIVVNYADPTIRNNIVIHNSGGQDYGGGGVWLFGANHTTTFDNNTVAGNQSNLTGGGVRVWNTNLVGRNNIVWGNRANSGAAQISGTAAQAGFTYSDVQGGFTGEGNIGVYPAFADTNLQLAPGSPAIDAGNPDPVYNDRDGSRNDMGAYGGPYAITFPPFSRPIAVAGTAVLNFGEGGPGIEAHANLILTNRGSSTLTIDSIRYVGNAGSVISFDTMLTRIGPFFSDTTVLTWAAQEAAPLADTLLLYHNDPAAANPLRIRLTGRLATGDVPGQGELLPQRFRLEQNYPNPFNAATEIRFDLPQAAETTLVLYDLLGREVALLVNGTLPAGQHQVHVDAQGLPSGMYLYRIQAGSFADARAMMLVR